MAHYVKRKPALFDSFITESLKAGLSVLVMAGLGGALYRIFQHISNC